MDSNNIGIVTFSENTLVSKWNKLFRIELILFIYFCADFPLSICAQRYILTWIKNQIVSNLVPSNNSLLHDNLQNANFLTVNQLQIISKYDFSIHDSYNNLTCIFNSSNHDFAIQQAVQKYSSEFLILRAICWTLPASVFIFCIGPVSDARGRHITILPPLVGQMILCVSIVFVLVFKLPIYVLLCGDFMAGCGGCFPCLLMGSVAYTIDQCQDAKILMRITLLQFSILIASSISPIAFGWLIDFFGNLPVILSTLILSSVSFIYTIALMSRRPSTPQYSTDVQPTFLQTIKLQIMSTYSLLFGSDELFVEGTSVKDENKVKSYGSLDCTTAAFNNINEIYNDVNSYTNAIVNDSSLLLGFDNSVVVSSLPVSVESTSDINEDSQALFVKSKRKYSNKTKLKVMFLCYFLAIIPSYDASMLSLFMMGLPLCWSPTLIGIYFGCNMAIAGFGSFIITTIIKNRFDNVIVGAFSAACFAILRLYMYFVKNTTMMFSGLALVMFLALLIPSMKTLMSQMIHKSRQGLLFGCLGFIDVIGFLLSATIFNLAYSQTLHYSSNFFFLISASILALACLILIIYRCLFGKLNMLDNH